MQPVRILKPPALGSALPAAYLLYLSTNNIMSVKVDFLKKSSKGHISVSE
jgi:hypothetical protein